MGNGERRGDGDGTIDACGDAGAPGDEQTTEQAAWEERPGCLLIYVTRLLVRLVLVAPPAIMGAQVGIWGAMRLGGDLSYVLAIAGVVTGGMLGLGLSLRGARGRSGAATRADFALCLLALVFLARVVMGWFVAPEFEDIGLAYLAALAGAAIVWVIDGGERGTGNRER